MLGWVERTPGHDLWRALIRQEPLIAPATHFPADLVERFCGLFGPALIDNALPGHVAPALARQARLLNRLITRRQTETVSRLIGRGHRVLAMKGFATSRFYHRDPESRITGDLDLLVDPADIEPVVASLLDLGFRAYRDLPLPAWGFLSEASFLTMTASDGLVDVDLHVLPDCYPLARGLPTDAVFAAARQLELKDVTTPVPCAEHMLLIALSNATKEKLGPQSVKSLLDAGRIVATESDLRWGSVETTLRRARLQGPARVARTVIRFLDGTETNTEGMGRLACRQLRDTLAELGTGFATGFPFHRKLLREALLTAEPPVALRRLRDRLRGLIIRRNGIPPGADIGGPNLFDRGTR